MKSELLEGNGGRDINLSLTYSTRVLETEKILCNVHYLAYVMFVVNKSYSENILVLLSCE